MVFRGILFVASKDRVILPPSKPLWKRGFDVFKIIHCSDVKIKKLLLAWLHGCHHCLAVRTSFDWTGLTEIHFIQSNYL